MSTPGSATRADSARTHQRLLDAAGELLAQQGTTFTLPDLARQARVSTATVYRHFSDVHDVFDTYYRALFADLLQRISASAGEVDPLTAFHSICDQWVRGAMSWGRSATHIRSARGYLARLRDDSEDHLTQRFNAVLTGAIEALAADPELGRFLSPIDVDYAVLLWITMFDERVVVDLTEVLGWSAERASAELAESLLGAWRQGRTAV
ncbi:TetR/AcrR family transcriptional regulator [Streptomyces sp. NPDC020747]|uniref:TetR/AcrR family transcriptional regulator n=1 Tax=Streptomyces sp. NPDC020747 TaxID=3365086 RepID=UPI003797721D